MKYPPYPLTYKEATKYSTDELMGFYDLLVGFGLNPIPKGTLDKRPLWQFWKDGVKYPTRSEALSYIENGTADGWFLVPGSEPTIRLMVLDLDVADILAAGESPEALYHLLQALSPTSFVIYTPSGGLHLYYLIPDDIDPPANIRPLEQYRGLEVRCPGIEVGVASFGGTAQYKGAKAKKKGVRDGLIGSYDPAPYGDFTFIPYAQPPLMEFLSTPLVEDDPTEAVVDTELTVDRRVANGHALLSSDKRLKVALEALDYALIDWGAHKTYEQWLALWMSAYSASDGNEVVLDFLTSDPRVEWSDGDKGIKTFEKVWREHKPRTERGYTVATLFNLAYANGWLASSTADLDDTDPDDTVSFTRMSDWVDSLDVIPQSVLLKSQTGSGKTYGIRAVWDKLDQPKTLILVPSIRLAIDMAATLREDLGMPAIAYRDEDTDIILPDDELVAAQVLVTTLQTFTRRLYVPDMGVMKRYGLIYIEECDALISSFAAGGGGEYTSHVRQYEAERGFLAIAEAFKDRCVVWGVDATATQVSYRTFEVLSQGDFLYIENAHVTPKPPVKFVEDVLGAYTIIQESLANGKSVVVPCDTAAEALSVYGTMLTLKVVSEDDAICITAPTAAIDNRVLSFAKDANKEAPKYRLMVYNSAMASGVSVTSFTPDVVVQMSRGYLTPLMQLQLLNRYRIQAEVYCYYGARQLTELDIDADKLVKRAAERAVNEAEYLLIPVLDRTQLANLRDELRAIAVSDAMQQRRNPAQFYRKLLIKDGRAYAPGGKKIILQRLLDAHEGDKEVRKEEMSFIASHWRDVPPMKRDFPSDWSAIKIRQSLVHQWLLDTLGDIPSEDYDQAYIFEVVEKLYKKSNALHAFVYQRDAARTSEKAIANKEKALLTHPNHVSRVLLAGLLRYLYRSPNEELSDDVMAARAMAFVRILEENKDLYHRVVRRARYQLDYMKENLDETSYAITAAKQVAATIGLKIRKSRAGKWVIANLAEVMDFLSWKNFSQSVEIDLTARELEEMREERVKLLGRFAYLTSDEMEKVTARLVNMPLETALAINSGRRL